MSTAEGGGPSPTKRKKQSQAKPRKKKNQALTLALLETVRLVLETSETEDDEGTTQDEQEPEPQQDPQPPQNSGGATGEATATDDAGGTSGASAGSLHAAEEGDEGGEHAGEPDQLGDDMDDDGFTPRRKNGEPRAGVPGGPCAHCGAIESPQWRRPLTKKIILCNACGIYYSRHHSLPKRKKVAGTGGSTSGQQMHPRPPKLPNPALKEPVGASSVAAAGPSSNIICDEKLEAKDIAEDDAAAQQAAAALAFQQAQAALLSHIRQPGALPPGVSPAYAQACVTRMADMLAKPLGIKEEERPRKKPALQLPLMTTLPVTGGINAIVDTFLKHPMSEQHRQPDALQGLPGTAVR